MHGLPLYIQIHQSFSILVAINWNEALMLQTNGHHHTTLSSSSSRQILLLLLLLFLRLPRKLKDPSPRSLQPHRRQELRLFMELRHRRPRPSRRLQGSPPRLLLHAKALREARPIFLSLCFEIFRRPWLLMLRPAAPSPSFSPWPPS